MLCYLYVLVTLVSSHVWSRDACPVAVSAAQHLPDYFVSTAQPSPPHPYLATVSAALAAISSAPHSGQLAACCRAAQHISTYPLRPAAEPPKELSPRAPCATQSLSSVALRRLGKPEPGCRCTWEHTARRGVRVSVTLATHAWQRPNDLVGLPLRDSTVTAHTQWAPAAPTRL